MKAMVVLIISLLTKTSLASWECQEEVDKASRDKKVSKGKS
jgi:hypothetical protein